MYAHNSQKRTLDPVDLEEQKLGAVAWVPGTNLNPLQKYHILWRAYQFLQSQTMLFKNIHRP